MNGTTERVRPVDGVATLLGMYDDMAELLEACPEDCDALAYGLSTIVEAGAPQVRELSRANGTQGATGLADAQRTAAAERARRFGDALNSVLPRCAEQLVPELKRMNALGTAHGP